VRVLGTSARPWWSGKAAWAVAEHANRQVAMRTRRRTGRTRYRSKVRIAVVPTAFVGIGSNLGEPERQIAAALELLAAEAGIQLVAASTLRETEPVGYLDQPRFLNGAAEIETELSAQELLERLLAIEARLGRVRGRGPRFGPRTIDLDLLVYGDETIDEPGLTVPHPRLPERRFALEPLAELAPGLEIPGSGPVQALLAELE
jgi:2-amino-4-hydroxy-6-hydroxymethyldihydropteridine diphosphokinase